MMTIARQLAIASEVRRVPYFIAERAAQRIERSGNAPALYVFPDSSQGTFVVELDARSRSVSRFAEVVA